MNINKIFNVSEKHLFIFNEADKIIKKFFSISPQSCEKAGVCFTPRNYRLEVIKD